MPKITQEQFKNGLEFFKEQYGCAISKADPEKECDGCEADFDVLLAYMEIDYDMPL